MTILILLLLGLGLISEGWSILLRPAGIVGSPITSESQAMFLGLFLVLLGIGMLGAGVVIVRRLFNYAKKWSRRR